MRREIKYGNNLDIEEELYPGNNKIEQIDAELLMQSDLPQINCCSAFEDIERRRFSKFENLNSE